MQRVIRVALASIVALVPAGSRAAELVVWWEEGWYPDEDRAVAELIASEAETGTDVELVRQPQAAQALVQAALEAGRPPDFLWGAGRSPSIAEQWAYEDRLVDLAGALGPVQEVFDADLLDRPALPTGARASAASSSTGTSGD